MDEYLYIKHRGIVSFLIKFLTMITAQEKSQIFHRKLVPYRGSGIVFLSARHFYLVFVSYN